MFPTATNGGGNCFVFPDVCNTPAPPAPPIPIPYPNTAMMNQAVQTSQKVCICSKQVVTTKSKIPRSQGDEPGTAGGIMSGMNMGPASFKLGSSKVKAEGHPVVFQSSMTAHNGSNANAPMGTVVSPSQTKVIVAP
jgi:hypothetical protein